MGVPYLWPRPSFLLTLPTSLLIFPVTMALIDNSTWTSPKTCSSPNAGIQAVHLAGSALPSVMSAQAPQTQHVLLHCGSRRDAPHPVTLGRNLAGTWRPPSPFRSYLLSVLNLPCSPELCQVQARQLMSGAYSLLPTLHSLLQSTLPYSPLSTLLLTVHFPHRCQTCLLKHKWDCYCLA